MRFAGHAALRTTALGVVVALLPAIAAGDTIVRKDSTVYQGRIIERTDEHVVFEVNHQGMTARMQFDWDDVAQLIESRPEAAKLAEQYREKRLQADQLATADAYMELGKWAHSQKLYDKAVAVLDKALRLAPKREAEIGFEIARSVAANNELHRARAILKDLSEKYPDDARIAAELAKIDQQAQKQVDHFIKPAVEKYRAGEMRAAIRLLERLQELQVDDLEEKADYASMQHAGMPFGELLAEARLHQSCNACGKTMQLGLQACAACNGTGKVTRTRRETVTERDPKTGIERRITRNVDYDAPCPTCHGFASVVCQGCSGAGVDLGQVGTVEREYVVAGLIKRDAHLCEKLEKYIEEPSSLHIVNLEVIHLHALRLQYYMDQRQALDEKLAGKPLKEFVARQGKLKNLLRHTTAQYRNRDLDKFEEAMNERLRQIVEADGLLWPRDLEYRDPTGVSSRDHNGPAPRP